MLTGHPRQIRFSSIATSFRSPVLFPHQGWMPRDDSSGARQWHRIFQSRRVTRQKASSDMVPHHAIHHSKTSVNIAPAVVMTTRCVPDVNYPGRRYCLTAGCYRADVVIRFLIVDDVEQAMLEWLPGIDWSLVHGADAPRLTPVSKRDIPATPESA